MTKACKYVPLHVRRMSRAPTPSSLFRTYAPVKGVRMFFGTDNGMIFVVDSGDLKVIHKWFEPNSSRQISEIVPLANFVIVGVNELDQQCKQMIGSIEIWDKDVTNLITTLKSPTSAVVNSCCFVNEGWLVAAFADNTLTVWEIQNTLTPLIVEKLNGYSIKHIIPAGVENDLVWTSNTQNTIQIWSEFDANRYGSSGLYRFGSSLEYTASINNHIEGGNRRGSHNSI